MKLSTNKSFEMNTNKIRNKKTLQKLGECMEEILKTTNPAEIQNLKKL